MNSFIIFGHLIKYILGVCDEFLNELISFNNNPRTICGNSTHGKFMLCHD